jgi:peptidoglycan/LPS O-acetylase OafA/YrhL
MGERDHRRAAQHPIMPSSFPGRFPWERRVNRVSISIGRAIRHIPLIARRTRLNRELSLYLDVVRFMAAITVFVSHLCVEHMTGGLFWQVMPFGSEAVTVFFVLSGFVIAYVTHERESSGQSYVVARAARIYSVALPALLVTLILDAIGHSARPDLYDRLWGFAAHDQLTQFLSGLFFLNRLWFVNVVIGSNISYWSLGFEVWYYIIFGIAMFFPVRWRLLGALGALILAGPSIAIMFPLWLLGVACYHICRHNSLGRLAGTILVFGSVAGWIAYEILISRYGRVLDFGPIVLDRRELPQDCLIATLFGLHIIGFRAISSTFAPVLERIARQIRWAAGASFSIYLYHLPIAQFLTTQIPWPVYSASARITIYGGTLLIAFALAEVTERRKDLWNRAFTWLLMRLVRPAANQE